MSKNDSASDSKDATAKANTPPEDSFEKESQPDRSPPKPPYCALSLELEGNSLIAVLTPNESPSPLSESSIKNMIQQQGYRDLFLLEDALKVVVDKAKLEEASNTVVAKKRDSEVSLSISDDKMQVKLSLTPAYGGNLPSKEQISAQAFDLSISKQCLHPKLIQEAITTCEQGQEVKDIPIAWGIAAKNGKDSEFESLVENEDLDRPQENEHGVIDYFETHRYLLVETGDPLMKRLPPTEGTDGLNVLGKELKAKPGKTLKFGKADGSEVDSNDENLLIASKDGHPVISHNTVGVDDTLQIKHANLETGNIRYDGSLFISGDVFPQVKIEVKGDVHIQGSVENAHITAGGDIVIAKGVISKEAPTEDNPQAGTFLKADKNIHALFLNQTTVEAKDNISIERYALHCDLKAGKSIILGENNGKGVLIGGSSIAKGSIEANILGSDAYVKTHLVCAPVAEDILTYKKLLKTLQRREYEKENLEIVLAKIKKNTHKVGNLSIDKAKKIENTISAITDKISQIKPSIRKLQAKIKSAKNGFVLVNKCIHPNTLIELNDVVFSCKEERSKTRLITVNGKLTFSDE